MQAAVEGELRLLDADVRVSPALVSRLLDPEFTEIGASGRRWDATSILTVTSSGSVVPGHPVEVTGMSGSVLAPGVVPLTYFAGSRGSGIAELPVAYDGSGPAAVLSPGHIGELSADMVCRL